MFDFDPEIFNVVAKAAATAEDSRAGLQKVYFDTKRDQIVATNGHQMIVSEYKMDMRDVAPFSVSAKEIMKFCKPLLKKRRQWYEATLSESMLMIKLRYGIDFIHTFQTCVPTGVNAFADYMAIVDRIQPDTEIELTDIQALCRAAEGLGAKRITLRAGSSMLEGREEPVIATACTFNQEITSRSIGTSEKPFRFVFFPEYLRMASETVSYYDGSRDHMMMLWKSNGQVAIREPVIFRSNEHLKYILMPLCPQ